MRARETWQLQIQIKMPSSASQSQSLNTCQKASLFSCHFRTKWLFKSSAVEFDKHHFYWNIKSVIDSQRFRGQNTQIIYFENNWTMTWIQEYQPVAFATILMRKMQIDWVIREQLSPQLSKRASVGLSLLVIQHLLAYYRHTPYRFSISDFRPV